MESTKGQYVDIITSMDEENKKCVDCNAENPTKISVNNGILICEKCAEEHQKLGFKVSYIRDLNDEFDEYLLNYLTLGSNSKFKRFLSEEHIDETYDIQKKYLTKACDYYRKVLKQKVKGDPLLEKNYENPNEILEEVDNYFPEFENYQIKLPTPSSKNKNKVQQAKNALTHFGANLFGLGKKAYSGVKQGAKFVAVKAQPAAKFVKKESIIAGKFVKKETIVAGKYVGKKVGGAYNDLKKKIVKLNKKNGNVPPSNNEQEGEGQGEGPQEDEKQEGGEQPAVEGGDNINNQDEPKVENNETPDTGALSNQPLGEIHQDQADA